MHERAAHGFAVLVAHDAAHARRRGQLPRADVERNHVPLREFPVTPYEKVAAEAEAKALWEAIMAAHGIFLNCEVTSGACCCGDDMQHHSDLMYCGHSPVDQGSYAASEWLKNYATLAQPADDGATP